MTEDQHTPGSAAPDRSSGRARVVVVLWLAVALLSCLLVYGYHHFDEIGQISAFYMQKAGVMPAESMAWEFPERMRPWLQPGLYYLLFGRLVDAGAPDGYPHLFLERATLFVQFILLAGAVWLLMPLLSAAPVACRRQRLAALSWALLWFAPSMLVRHSSEAFATALWAASAAVWWRVESGRDRQSTLGLVSGLLAGLSVWGRFQVGMLVAPFWVARWFGRHEDRPSKALIGFAVGILMAVGIGVAVDTWGYGELTLSPWRYFAANVLEGKASGFGVSPWHQYLGDVTVLTLNPLILAWFAWAAWVTRREPFYRSLSIGMAVFLVVHMAIPHKEPRFLLPLLAPATLLLLYAFSFLREGEEAGTQRWLFAVPYLRFVIALNFIALVGFTTFGLVGDQDRVYRALWRLPRGERTVLSATNLFGHFDGYVGTPPPAGFERESYRRFLQPGWLAYVYVHPSNLAEACAERPAALWLSTNHELSPEDGVRMHADRLADEADVRPTLAEFPPPWLQSDADWFKRMWRFRLVRCSPGPFEES